MTRIMGLDLSMVNSGLSTHDGQLYSWVPEHAGDVRLIDIEERAEYYLLGFRPEFVVIEEVPFTLRSKWALMALVMVHGVVRKELARLNIPFGYVTTTRLKKYATGSGSASKQQMIDAAREVGCRPGDDNQADAFWARALGQHAIDGKAPSVVHALAADLVAAQYATWRKAGVLPAARTKQHAR